MTEATVIIPAFRAKDTLARCLQSAITQENVAVEIVVVDDASPDDTAACARALAEGHANVRVLSLPENGGPSAARNAALAQAQGEWIAVLDADDAFEPGRLQRLVDFGRRTQADIVCDTLVQVGEDGSGTTLSNLAFEGDPAGAAWTVPQYIAGNRMRAGALDLGYLKPLFRRAFLEEHGLSYDTRLRNGEDFHFVLAALMAGARMRYLPFAGYRYTTRAGSISNRLDPEHARALAIADREFLDRNAGRLAPATRRTMRERMQVNADLAAAESAMQALKEGRILRAGGALLRRPRALRRFALQLREAGVKRLTGPAKG